MKIRVGTRSSKLALVQANLFVERVRAARPDVECELVPMTTTGDQILDRPLDQVGGKGLFVRELDRALLAGDVDVTVHSCKDMPMDPEPGLPLAAFSVREDPRDCFVLPEGVDAFAPGFDILAYLREDGRPIGCSSARRRVQLARIVPGIDVQSVRGNVGTRLSKLDAGQFSALVLARAGLVRLGLANRASLPIEADVMIPSACQGIMVAQVREGEDAPWLGGFADADSARVAVAERAFVRALGGGCTKPCGAFATPREGGVELSGMYATEDLSGVAYGHASIADDELEAGAKRLAMEVRRDAEAG